MKSKKIAYVILVIVLCIALVIAVAFAVTANIELANLSSNSDQRENNTVVLVPEVSSDASPSDGSSTSDSKGVTKDDVYYITDVSEDFLDAFFNYDSAKPEEYEARYNNLLTQNGRQNMSSEISRYTPPSGRYVEELISRKVYLQSSGNNDAKVLCLAYVMAGQRGEKDSEEDEKVASRTARILQINLKKEADGAWRVNSMQYNYSLHGVDLDLDTVFG